MADNYKSGEKREFLRHAHEKPVHYKILDLNRNPQKTPQLVDAVSKNLSASGILFSSKKMPDISSLLMLDLDYRITRICKEIEENALIVDNKLFGKVVRIEDNGSGYDIGVAFIKKFDHLADTLKEIMG